MTSSNTKIEWPTWILIGFVYSIWILLVWQFNNLPIWLGASALTLILTLHSSMCHEIIHGHPTKNVKLNNLLAYPAIGLIYPYTVFKETHLKHHNNLHITYPGIDPESFFHTREKWKGMNSLHKALAWINMTLAGRLLLGPANSIYSLAKESLIDLIHNRPHRKIMWLFHYAFVTGLLWWVNNQFSIPAWLYFGMSYFSLSLIQLRSFFEHQPVKNPSGRSVIQDTCLFSRFLYLNNNYHFVHHKHPSMAWYQLAREFKDNKEKYIEESCGFYYTGYGKWLRYLFWPIHSPIHPFYQQKEPANNP